MYSIIDSPVRRFGAVVAVEASLLPILAVVDARTGCFSEISGCVRRTIGDHAARLTFLTRFTRFQFGVERQFQSATLGSWSTTLFCVTVWWVRRGKSYILDSRPTGAVLGRPIRHLWAHECFVASLGPSPRVAWALRALQRGAKAAWRHGGCAAGGGRTPWRSAPPRACAGALSLAARYATREPIQIAAEGSVGLEADRNRPIPALNVTNNAA